MPCLGLSRRTLRPGKGDGDHRRVGGTAINRVLAMGGGDRLVEDLGNLGGAISDG